MLIDLTSSSFSTVFDKFSDALYTQPQSENGGLTIHVPRHIGEGTVSSWRFHSGLSLVVFQVKFREDLVIKTQPSGYHPLRLLFCKNGYLTHSVNARSIQYQLHPLNCSLTACSGDVDQIFNLPPNESLSLFMVEIDREFYLQRIKNSHETVHTQLRRVFEDKEVTFPFLYQSHYSHTASEILKAILNSDRYQGIVRDTYLESKVLELLSISMNQYSDDQKQETNRIVLRDADIKLLKEAHSFVTENYVAPPSIQELAKIVGINEFKLKKGYKQLFKMTIYEHIREEKLNQARMLIAEGRYDIGEVVRQVGYSNRSHFAARFKEKFGQSPKRFQKESLVKHSRS